MPSSRAAAEFAQGELAPLNDVGDRHCFALGRRRGNDASGLPRGLCEVRRGRMDGTFGVRRGRRAGASEQPVGRDDGGLQRGERRFRTLPDAWARSGGGHRSPRFRGAEARLSAEDRQRRMDRDDEPDRAAGGQRRRSAQIARGAGGRRKLADIRHQDLHHLWRARPDRQHHSHGARPHARSAGRHEGHFAVPRAEGAARRRVRTTFIAFRSSTRWAFTPRRLA